MKKHLLLIFAVLLSMFSSAQNRIEIDGIWYNLYKSLQKAEVTYKGQEPWDYHEYSGSIAIPTTVTHEGVTYSVTSIGEWAFSKCRLTDITIPASVTSIGNSAFDRCSNLTDITIPASVTSIRYGTFAGCSSLTAITIPESVTSIGDYAFEYCCSLTAINIPQNVTSIGNYAFQHCSSLTAITVDDENTIYDSRSGCNAIIETNSNTLIQGCSTTIIPENVTSIGNYAFSGCSSLTTITIPEGVTSIGDVAFGDCSSLTDINIPESVTNIGSGAFGDCSSLTDINIPESVTSIGNYAFSGTSWYNKQPDGVVYAGKNLYKYKGSIPNNTSIEVKGGTKSITGRAFYDCSGLTAINIPEGVTNIGEWAFYGCSSLTAITIPASVTSIGEWAFYDCSNLTSINIPEGVTNIRGRVFSDCSSLTAITIPEGVTSIGNYAFYDCSNLTTINIPENSQLTSIGEDAFRYCCSLTAINIPKGVTNIENWAFCGCSSLTAITCGAATPPTIEFNTFDNVDKSIPIYVPTGSVEAYQVASYWKRFTNIIGVEKTKCATPTVSYVDGKLLLNCDTEGAVIKTNVFSENDCEYIGTEFEFVPTHTFTAYATKENYEDSDVATLTICWIPCSEAHESEEDGILTIPSKPVLISTQGGTITVSGLAADTEVAAYTTAGTQLATATATGGTITLDTGLEAGSIAIVKIGEHSVKIAVK